ncbi:Uncharacterised protein [Mycolicibacterium vanbaalenii]|uniref:Uncharacterized protein n=1 Tax=Mycolicibacterium vanbaalenii TaxID=110539 RepID=A0A5S9RAT8_MYCVN|nr:Uncharacterised protein [Mycolicibacterium vanbaalenii]
MPLLWKVTGTPSAATDAGAPESLSGLRYALIPLIWPRRHYAGDGSYVTASAAAYSAAQPG